MHKQRYDMFDSIDYVPPSLPISLGRARMYLLEDNDAVIKMVIKERSPALRHVARTHRVDLDWIFERINRDPNVYIKFVGTKEQLADVLTKGVRAQSRPLGQVSVQDELISAQSRASYKINDGRRTNNSVAGSGSCGRDRDSLIATSKYARLHSILISESGSADVGDKNKLLGTPDNFYLLMQPLPRKLLFSRSGASIELGSFSDTQPVSA